MDRPMPPLNALRAFEAAARHLSMTKAAQELHVTAGALSHQIRGLECALGLKLFQRGVRSISLTVAGRQLYPALRVGFTYIRDAVNDLACAGGARILVVSSSPGLTSKWLAPRLYGFSGEYPDIDARVSSSFSNADFTTDGVDVALRNLSVGAVADPDLMVEKLFEMHLLPVCSPKLIEARGPFATPAALSGVPLIHDESLANRAEVPNWGDWFKAAGVGDADTSHGLRFSNSDHAIDATLGGAGVLLAPNILAYDALRTGQLVVASPPALRSGRAYYLVYPKDRQDRPNVRAFRTWIRQEVSALDWDIYLCPA
jgi:LysR family glycine cleavage system transcriptional activator